MEKVTVQIYRDRKIVFEDSFDNGDKDLSYCFRDYYFAKAKYECADKIVFKFVPTKEIKLEELPF